MELIVRLRKLNTLINLQHDDAVNVFIDANPFGTCLVVKSTTGEHFGILTLDNDLNRNLWVHYDVENHNGRQHLLGIYLKNERRDSKALLLKEIIVDDQEIIMNFKN